MASMNSIRDTFFEECEELLEALAEGLALIQDGDQDPETVNAVFRAVHSIKGGAGAFALAALVHRFHYLKYALAVVLIFIGLKGFYSYFFGKFDPYLSLAITIGITAIAASLPMGILLALGRRSDMFLVKTLSVGFIEFIRGVPLITLLFTASLLLAYFLPPGTNFDLILRVITLTALSTASSNATYPVSKRALEAFGVSERVTSLTLPLGATLNMHGSALYQSILLIFMSQLAGADLSPWQTVFIVLLTMASSAGTAGIPGGGIAMMAFMLDLLGLPPTYLALYLVVDRFFDYPITAINVWGDLVVAAIVDQELKDG